VRIPYHPIKLNPTKNGALDLEGPLRKYWRLACLGHRFFKSGEIYESFENTSIHLSHENCHSIDRNQKPHVYTFGGQ
jgi:hypothetical protein